MNDHIQEAVKQYVEQKAKPEYGILIKGEWGSGKTYFVSELQKLKWLRSNDGNKIIKISLYGVESKQDIERLLFLELSKLQKDDKSDDEAREIPGWLKAVGAGASSVFKGKFNIDTNSIMPYLLLDYIKNVKVIIVDDLERSSMLVNEIMGYFYNHIIDRDIRVIFIGNETEISDISGLYSKTKEKVIGESYTIQPLLKEAVESFLSRGLVLLISNDRATNTCLKVADTLKVYNLRTIWQALIHVQRLLKEVVTCDAYNNIKYLDTDYKDGDRTKEDYLVEILELYLVFYIQKSKGDIIEKSIEVKSSSNIIDTALIAYKNNSSGVIEYIEKQKEDEEKEKKENNESNRTMNAIIRRMSYEYNDFKALFLSKEKSTSIWSDFLFHSKIDKEKLNRAVYEDSNWFTPRSDIKSNLFKLVSGSYSMEQKDFEICYDSVLQEFEDGKYKDVGEFMHFYSLCLTYKEYGVKDYGDDEINAMFDRFLKNTELEVMTTDSSWSIYDRSSMGYAYSTNMTKDEGREFVEKLETLENKKRAIDLKHDIIHEFNHIKTSSDLDAWLNLLYINNSGRDYNGYYDSPILSWIGSNSVFVILIDMSYRDQHKFIRILKERYGAKYANGTFKEAHHADYNVLLNLEDKLAEHIKNLDVGSINKLRLGVVIEVLHDLIEYCSSFVSEDVLYSDH